VGKSEANLRCDEGNARLMELKEGLNKMSLTVNRDYLSTFLTNRLIEINQVLDQCPITQTGLIAKNYLGTGNEFEMRVPRARFQDYKITFDQPFTEVPNVAVSLAGFDLDTEIPAVAALVPQVTESDFTLRVYLVPYARLYSVQVSYLATLPSSSGIYPKLHMVDYEHDKEFSTKAESVGPRSLEKKLAPPTDFQNSGVVGVVTFLNGCSFGAGADPRLKVSVSEVTPTDFTLRYSTAGSTRFLSAVTYNLIYKTTDRIVNDATEAAPEKGSTFYKGFGSRSQTVPSLSLGVFNTKPEIFTGLFAFDFTTGYGYRVSQNMDLKYDNGPATADLSFETNGDSKVNLVKSSIFYTCHNRLC